jgi:hypothetical protein
VANDGDIAKAIPMLAPPSLEACPMILSRVLLLLALPSTVAFAEGASGFLQLSGGVARPDYSGVSGEEYSFSLRGGGGLRAPISPVVDGLFGVYYGAEKLAVAIDGRDEVDREAKLSWELIPRSIQLDASAMWNPIEALGLQGGFNLTIPFGGTWIRSLEVDGFNDASSGDLDSLDGVSPSTFPSLLLGVHYTISRGNSIGLNWTMPLGTWSREHGQEIDYQRLWLTATFGT